MRSEPLYMLLCRQLCTTRKGRGSRKGLIGDLGGQIPAGAVREPVVGVAGHALFDNDREGQGGSHGEFGSRTGVVQVLIVVVVSHGVRVPDGNASWVGGVGGDTVGPIRGGVGSRVGIHEEWSQ